MTVKIDTKIQGPWYLYIVRCRDGSLYTGISTDVKRRLAEHRENRGAKYLRGRGPLSLVFKKIVGSHTVALKTERLVKKLPIYKKERLIRTGSWDAASNSLAHLINTR